MTPITTVDDLVKVAQSFDTWCGIAEDIMRGRMTFPCRPDAQFAGAEARDAVMRAKRAYDRLVEAMQASEASVTR